MNEMQSVQAVSDTALIKNENDVTGKDYAGMWSGSAPMVLGKDFTTFETEDFDEMLQGITSPDIIKLSDALNLTLEINNVYMENVQIVSDETGEQVILPRILLFTVDGNVYSCVSVTAFNALTKIFNYKGFPSKQHTLKLIPKQRSQGKKKFYNFVIPKE